MLAWDVVVSKPRYIHILSFQSGSSHPQVITQVASHPAERIARTNIGKISDFPLGHSENSLFGGDSVLSHRSKAEASAHDYTVPDSDFVGGKIGDEELCGELLPGKGEPVLGCGSLGKVFLDVTAC